MAVDAGIHVLFLEAWPDKQGRHATTCAQLLSKSATSETWHRGEPL